MSPEYVFAMTLLHENLLKADERRLASEARASRRPRRTAAESPTPSHRWRPLRWAGGHA